MSARVIALAAVLNRHLGEKAGRRAAPILLDLLIDGEQGLWHLANQGALTWHALACRAAEAAGLPQTKCEVYKIHLGGGFGRRGGPQDFVVQGVKIAMAMPGQRAGMLNTGPHGLSEVLYAFTSAANNNGSAFAGLSVNTTWYNTALGLAMVLGRFVPIILVLALAGSLAAQGRTPESIGTLPTHRPQFIGMVAGVTLILVALTFLPMLALGPLAEGIH